MPQQLEESLPGSKKVLHCAVSMMNARDEGMIRKIMNHVLTHHSAWRDLKNVLRGPGFNPDC